MASSGINSSILFLIVCLVGAVLSQTFQYSRGWTNGKKRGGSIGAPVPLQDVSEDVLGVCQLLQLREIIAPKRRQQVLLPCEVIGKPEEEILERFRRRTSESEPSVFDATATHEK